jgi:hypothetical protein
MSEKICPLFVMAPEGNVGGDATCNKDKCAWWNSSLEKCSIAVLALKLGREIRREDLRQ